MREAPAWFDRTFDVAYPAELLPQLLTRLRGSPARLEEMARSSSRAGLIAKRDGRWSAQENAGHLVDLEPLWLARVDDYVSARSELTPADLTNRKTNDANHNASPLDRALADFRAARETLMRRLAGVDASLFTQAIPHPRLGTPMRLPDHLYFVAEHDDHHLARIWNLIGTAP
jgi:uncharacterized damage-inducible protein DinB